MTTKEEEFTFPSGLPLDDVDAVIKDMEFGYNAAIGAGVVCANITFDVGGMDVDQSFSLGGDGWEILDKGAAVAGENGRKGISGNSNYGRLMASMVKAAGGVDNIPADTPKRVAGWLGTSWHLGTVKVKTMNPTTKEEKEKDAIVATAFLGVVNGAAAKPSSSKSTADAPAAAAADSPLMAADPALWARLVEMAEASETHAAFVAKALDLDEVDGNALAAAAIASKRAGSVWAAREPV